MSKDHGEEHRGSTRHRETCASKHHDGADEYMRFRGDQHYVVQGSRFRVRGSGSGFWFLVQGSGSGFAVHTSPTVFRLDLM